ncbi:MAG: DEAD/DEAH box helicase [Streptosporangiales bacterium]|nr:DEAD/DEAH box helicase [Streptosporangiales bacterium]
MSVPLRRHQREALDALDQVVRGDRRRAWVVLPPGAGKTLVGLEFARRAGQPTVVFGPNTAIQTQWVREWAQFTPAVVPVGTDRALDAPLTALTYQALATFSPDDEVDEDGQQTDPAAQSASLLDRLHPNGQALVAAMHAQPELTVVLDECHHLLEVWGRLLVELLAEIPQARVLGLTATPPDSLSVEQRDLVAELFGETAYAATIPAAVREGTLAPFGELVWLTTPTSDETDWLAGETERFLEMVTDLTDPSFGSVPFLHWLDQRFVRRSADGTEVVPWYKIEQEAPDVARAVLRFHNGGLLGLPTGARLREEHRARPTADDWVLLVDDWVRNCLTKTDSAGDLEAAERIRDALPSIGYRLTRAGIRAGRSPVDRVLARSAAKTDAVVEIVRAESANIGDRMRLLVLCDHERATATLPARLSGVLAEDAGSARLVLETLVGAETAALDPVLVTGRVVAAAADTARALVAYVTEHAPEVRLDPVSPEVTGVVEITGDWRSRHWVRLVTDFFEAGGCRVLVGTRALLGEGWDAKGVTGVVDLTTATTPTAVVQTRGRALRIDPRWPDKVALTWTVVCVTEQHPKGATDWGRFVRKHEGYYALDDHGEVVGGVAHVDAALSPYAPPPVAEFAGVNAAMLQRAGGRELLGERWQVGQPYLDRFVHTLRVRTDVRPTATRRAETLVAGGASTAAPVAVPAADGVRVNRGSVPSRGRRPVVLAGTSLLLAFTVLRLRLFIAAIVFVLGMIAALVMGVVQVWRAGRLVLAAAEPVDTLRIAYAVADGLRDAELSPVGADGVRWNVEPDGSYQFALEGVAEDVSARFARALDDAISPIATPRYVVPRYLLDPPTGDLTQLLDGTRLLAGKLRPKAVVWHAVPEELGVNAGRAKAYAQAWRRWVSDGEPLYTGSPEGAGVLQAQSGADPFAVTTAMRVAWR